MDNAILSKIADNIRILAAAMPERAKSGHPGGPMGVADFMALLYSEFMIFDPDDMTWPHRDRFFLDAGHLSAALYATLATWGHFSMEDLARFRQWGSPTQGHPELDPRRGVENTSGPLGQGHVMALGAAIAERFLRARFGEWMSHRIWCLISDGGIQEEVSQGVGRLAGHLGMGHLILFFDSNSIQLSHGVSDTTSEDTAAKYRAWGWHVATVDGHDFDAMRTALRDARDETRRPSLIIGKTRIGKGTVDEDGKPYENTPKLHGNPISKGGGSFEKTIAALGGQPDNPFCLFDEVARAIETLRGEKSRQAAVAKDRGSAWAAESPDRAAKLRSFLAGEVPPLDFDSIDLPQGGATRAASRACLGYMAEKVENMIVASCDLANSDYTDGFLKKSSILRKEDFTGAFLQAGVSELTMAGIMTGIALHGGCIPVGGTFFAFSDFQKPATRLAAIMGAHVIYVWSHDSFRVGEDGPTHQPIEQEAQIRLLERIRNFEGKRSFTALRPADGAEVAVAWKLALEFTGPVGLLLSRQPIPDLPALGTSGRRAEAGEAARGAYVVWGPESSPDLILVANGSETALMVEAAQGLQTSANLKVRVVSAISPGLFREQDPAYRERVLPFGVPTLGWTAGSPSALEFLVGPLGKVRGMERFGASAPFQVLDEKFGYTTENAIAECTAYLEEYRGMVERIASAQVKLKPRLSGSNPG